MIIQTTAQQGAVSIGDITPVVNTLEAGVDTTPDSLYWWQVYKSAQYPMVTVDKDYFCLYSTDHDGSGGGVWMGKSDSPDPRDGFVEVGQVIESQYQAETPYLWVFPGHERPLFLYYHTGTTDPANTCTVGQETRLRTTTGGDLVNSTWVQETNPLGCEVGSQHCGYLRFWNIDGTIIGNHHFNGNLPLTFQRSTTTDGLTFTRGTSYSQYNDFIVESDRSWVLSWSQVFRKGGKYYAFTNSADDTNNFSGGSSSSGKVYLVEVNSSLQITKLVKTLNGGNEGQAFSFYIEGNTAHFYRQTGRTDRPMTFNDFLGYSTLDISSL